MSNPAAASEAYWRLHSTRIVRRTRMPSENAWRLLAPYSLPYSTLGTSTIWRMPATADVMRVSISNPSPHCISAEPEIVSLLRGPNRGQGGNGPECVVAVAEVGVARAAQRVHEMFRPCSRTAKRGVSWLPPPGMNRDPGEIVPMDECLNELGDLFGPRRAIGIHHHDDVLQLPRRIRTRGHFPSLGASDGRLSCPAGDDTPTSTVPSVDPRQRGRLGRCQMAASGALRRCCAPH